MKVVAFNGSPRPQGNTAFLLKKVLSELEKEGIETELVHLGGNAIHGCLACGRCGKNKNGKCVIETDIINSCIAKMIEADGIIIGSPTYFADITSETKALIDRSGLVALSNGGLFRRKVGAAVIAVRRGGATNAFDSINKLFFINQMVVPGSSYWNFGVGSAEGSVAEDDEGLKTMKNLGENMAWLLKKLHA